ncbi:hypothetical protein [Mesonia aestuariivivens]|uniref:Long-subunit fatty acid transport protein n=1 Tax=Mesonia aestuariivivens TaxID=2796128 RepID=A0ABS6VXV9_9FLAO|nr:hypothetical protein [Mesonia aestuariivivens]MBW2960428.1 hypothetical protein [Mesonia aestuariivivens]
MIKQLVTIAILLFTVTLSAQEITSSPYSFYGIGVKKFKGTAENRSMGGLSIVSDSIHVNLQNPAGYGALALTTYTIAGSHTSTTISSTSAEDKLSSTNIDYLAIGIPAGKLGFGFGVVPYSSVGYELRNQDESVISDFTGRGGLNKLFLAAGYEVNKNLRIGVEGSYNFGNIQNKNIIRQSGIQFATREINRSDLSGFNVKFGAQYEKMINQKLQLTGSASFAPSSNLKSDNFRELATIRILNDTEAIADVEEVNVADDDLKLPSELSLGAGIGQPRKWFVGAEFQQLSASEFTNRSFTLDNVSYNDASTYKIGGYFIPNYNDITSYFKRIVYRAGARYGGTGLTINGEDVDEFGISFGVGLPAGRLLTNTNIGVEFGKRGTTDAGLVEEKFVSFYISLSLNDRWFQQRKFN